MNIKEPIKMLFDVHTFRFVINNIRVPLSKYSAILLHINVYFCSGVVL